VSLADTLPTTIKQALGAALMIVVTALVGCFFGRRNGRPRGSKE
jgi:hypothetical protein